MNVQNPSLPQAADRLESAIQPGYMSGFGNGFETEALPGALPIGRNSPQKCAYGLYAEQLSGSPFTAPRTTNERSWLYRIRPTVTHWGQFQKADIGLWRTAPAAEVEVPIAPMRWDPIPMPDEQRLVPGGHPHHHHGGRCRLPGRHGRACLPRHPLDGGRVLLQCRWRDAVRAAAGLALRLWTEFGIIDIEPGEIAVIPRGVKIRVELTGGPARGYLCENYGGAFTLPERGPIGANCLANPRDFLTPVAAYEDKDAPSKMYVKWGGSLWVTDMDHSPLDVVAWHGNYAPYKYDLRRYSPVGPILYDHADPSIFTVLTSPSETPGTANIDFVIFPDRWLVAENTFRPPWYHMNVMSEFMGLIYGVYDAKTGGGFVPGGMSLHNTMLPHGPDVDAFEKASNVELKPHKLEGTMAFMFETRFPQKVTAFAAQTESLQKDYGVLRAQAQEALQPEPAVSRDDGSTRPNARPEAGKLGGLGQRPPGLPDPEPAAGDLQPQRRLSARRRGHRGPDPRPAGCSGRRSPHRRGRRGGRSSLRPSAQPVPGARRRPAAGFARPAVRAAERRAARSRAGWSRACTSAADCTMHLPAHIGDYTDFYVGIHHATNVGKLFRPDNPLLPNYKYVPIGYHGRASSIRPSGTPVRRPNGQAKPPDAAAPSFGPSRRLDYELELGVWIGPGNELGEPDPDQRGGRARRRLLPAERLVGARHPGLGIPAARTVPVQELRQHRLGLDRHAGGAGAVPRSRSHARPEGDPAPLPYLLDEADQREGALDLELEVLLLTPGMRDKGLPPHRLRLSNARHMYWTVAQMVAHHTSNGCNLQPGDLLGTGTISAPDQTSCGSLLEATRAGRSRSCSPPARSGASWRTATR